jgi:hypothetical protein
MKGILFILGLLALAGLFSCNQATLNGGNNFTCYVYATGPLGDTVATHHQAYTNWPLTAQEQEDSLKATNHSNNVFVNCQ